MCLSALGLSLAGDQSNTNLRCAVMHFKARDGVLSSQQIVLDTDPTRLDGHGSVESEGRDRESDAPGQAQAFPVPASERAHHAHRQAGRAGAGRGQPSLPSPRAPSARDWRCCRPSPPFWHSSIRAWPRTPIARESWRMPATRARPSGHRRWTRREARRPPNRARRLIRPNARAIFSARPLAVPAEFPIFAAWV